ncbi:hypothetical protein JCM11491_006179 [Sporobolomyces phaffii]
MASPIDPSVPSHQLDELSSPSTRAGSAARPVTELAQEEPRIVTGDLRGPYEANNVKTGGVARVEDGVSKVSSSRLSRRVDVSRLTSGMQLAIDHLSSSPAGSSQASVGNTGTTGAQVEGIEPLGARKAANPPPASVKEPAPAIDVAEHKLRDVAATASTYLPSQETRQHAIDTTKETLATTASAAIAGASLASNAISSGAQAAFDAVQPLLPETLGGPHDPANDRTVNDNLDDLVARAAEAKDPISGSTKAITATPDATTAGKEEERHFDTSRSHPEPALDAQQPSTTSQASPDDRTTLHEPKIPLDATTPSGIVAAVAYGPASASALAIDKSRAGTASAPPASPSRLVDDPASTARRASVSRSESPSSTAANVDPAETKDPAYHALPSTHRTLDSDRPALKVIDLPQSRGVEAHGDDTKRDKEEGERKHVGLKDKLVEKVKSVVHH